MDFAIVHDYLTQRGGAERVVLALTAAFPDRPIVTAVYAPDRTYDEFRSLDVRELPVARVPGLRRDHRLGLPLYAAAFTRARIDADLLVCSSSGWAHATPTGGAKVVYCHNPARWLYQTDEYVGRPARGLRAVLGPLRAWDRRAAAGVDRYLANSRVVRDRIARTYGIDAEVIPPPLPPLAARPVRVGGVEPGFALVVSRLLPYKGVDVVVRACAMAPAVPLVVVGRGPHADALARLAGPGVRFLDAVSDGELRWLYESASTLVAWSHEDFGLTVLEANRAGVPVVARRGGGYLETVVDGTTGLLVPASAGDDEAPGLRRAIDEVRAARWDPVALGEHAAAFEQDRFVARMRAVAQEVLR